MSDFSELSTTRRYGDSYMPLRKMRCQFCSRPARLVTMPVIGDRAWLCYRHGPARTLAAMRRLVAHG